MIQAQQATIESRYGAPLSWERLPDRGAYRIADYGEGDITVAEDYAFYIDWMVDAQERLRRALGDVVPEPRAARQRLRAPLITTA